MLAFAGDLKLEGPVSGQVKMLLEENAALQVSSLLLTAVKYPVVPEKQLMQLLFGSLLFGASWLQASLQSTAFRFIFYVTWQ